MDAKFNWIIDSLAARVTIHVAVFSVWLALAYALLK
jgi:hypothetical protein